MRIQLPSRRIAAGAVATSMILGFGVLAANADGEPPGNNGTVKIGNDEFDSAPPDPDNDPHVDCEFQVDFFDFAPDAVATVTFEMQAPTKNVTLGGTAPSTVALDENGDGSQAYTLTFDGPAHEQQGYHVKLTVEVPDPEGQQANNYSKFKVFWVEDCAPVTPPPPKEPPPDEPPPDEPPPAEPPPAEPPAQAAAPGVTELPKTGADLPVILGAALLLLGGATVLFARRIGGQQL